MGVTGPPSHIDLSVTDPDRSIPFYHTFFTALGYERLHISNPEFSGERPTRAGWFIRYQGGAVFGIEVRPARTDAATSGHDRYSPGLHHLAFHAADRATVDSVHRAILAGGGEVLDPPADYSEDKAYSRGYYAVFFVDPDGVKLEVVHEPLTNANIPNS